MVDTETPVATSMGTSISQHVYTFMGGERSSHGLLVEIAGEVSRNVQKINFIC